MKTNLVLEKDNTSPSDSSVASVEKSEAPSSSNGARAGNKQVKLSEIERFLAFFFLVSWLFLFAGGITMDTTKFRCTISPGGVKALEIEGRPGVDIDINKTCNDEDFWIPSWISNDPNTANANANANADAYKLTISWIGLLLFFLPLNLVMISAIAGAIGALGNRANLEDDQTQVSSRDNSNFIISGLLRGLFVYLFFISGLLLFDDKPFSSPSPGQYIRLAGFVSMLSFLINYRPHLFGILSAWAFERINSRNGQDVVQVTQKSETTVSAPEGTITSGGGGKANGLSRPPS